MTYLLNCQGREYLEENDNDKKFVQILQLRIGFWSDGRFGVFYERPLHPHCVCSVQCLSCAQGTLGSSDGIFVKINFD